MVLLVHSVGLYRIKQEEGEKWTNSDWKVSKLVKACKGEAFGGFAEFTVGGRTYRLEPGRRELALNIAALFAGKRLSDGGLSSAVLVPIPASSTTNFDQECTASLICCALNNVLRATTTERCLAFKEEHLAAHRGGMRNATLIQQGLKFRRFNAGGRPIVLVDDVLTSGSHLRGAAAVLRAHGHSVSTALVLARTSYGNVENAFKTTPVDIEAPPSDASFMDW